jgi:type II secretory pathway component PulJ
MTENGQGLIGLIIAMAILAIILVLLARAVCPNAAEVCWQFVASLF